MRFSSAFQPKPTGPQARGEEAAREDTQAAPSSPAQDLPEDLDARVRLVGEWQLGEA